MVPAVAQRGVAGLFHRRPEKAGAAVGGATECPGAPVGGPTGGPCFVSVTCIGYPLLGITLVAKIAAFIASSVLLAQ